MGHSTAGTVDAAVELGQRLDGLFRATSAPSGRAWTNSEMAAQLKMHGVQATPAYVSMLRRGKRDNPSLEVLTGMAAVFGVPTAYFYDAETASRIDTDLQLIVAIRRDGLARIALRAAALSDTGRRELGVIIEAFRRLEGLDEDDAAGDVRVQNFQDRTV